MSENRKVISFVKKPSKIIDRSQTEILRDRKEKREEILRTINKRIKEQ